jgi:hypothetical protein
MIFFKKPYLCCPSTWVSAVPPNEKKCEGINIFSERLLFSEPPVSFPAYTTVFCLGNHFHHENHPNSPDSS